MSDEPKRRDNPCRFPEQDDLDKAAEQTSTAPLREPLTFDRVKLAADEFGKLGEMLRNEDVAELCAQLAQLLDEVEPSDLDKLFGGYMRIGLLPEGDQPTAV